MTTQLAFDRSLVSRRSACREYLDVEPPHFAVGSASRQLQVSTALVTFGTPYSIRVGVDSDSEGLSSRTVVSTISVDSFGLQRE